MFVALKQVLLGNKITARVFALSFFVWISQVRLAFSATTIHLYLTLLKEVSSALLK